MAAQKIKDKLGRSMRDLRVSVTDRCNFRCTYCMPKEVFNSDYQFMARSELLSFEEIIRIAAIFVGLGVVKVRLTGGEPLIRRNIERLIEQLAVIPDLEDVSLTTNGSLLTQEKSAQLKDAGLKRITVSLDSLDNAVFQSLNGVDFPVSKVLDGIDNAAQAGLQVKVNMVVKRGVNSDYVLPMARKFYGTDHILRFIEYMDVGNSNEWKLDEVMSGREIVDVINAEMPIEPAMPHYTGEVAKRWLYRDGGGEIGVITSVSQPFCSQCGRIRLSADGKLYGCLFASEGYDARRLLRDGASDEEIRQQLIALWANRQDRYSELRSENTHSLKKVEMSYIGG